MTVNTKNMKIKLARRLIKSGKYYCPLCGYVMTFITCNIDHIIPKARGGGNIESNLQLAHIECNHKKGGKLQRGYSDIQYPLNKKIAEARKERKGRRALVYASHSKKTIDRAAANGNDYAKMIQKRMKQYYAEVDARLLLSGKVI